jgi:hypothetical protein
MDVLKIFTENTFKLAQLIKNIEDELAKLKIDNKDDEYRIPKLVSLANTSIKAIKAQSDIAEKYVNIGDELRQQLFMDIKNYIDLLWQQTLVNTFEDTQFDKYLAKKNISLDKIKSDVMNTMESLDGSNTGTKQIN